MAKNGYQHKGLPSLKENMRFRVEEHEAYLIVTPDGDESPITFWRHERRWRFANGPFANIHAIAVEIFDYQSSPSRDEMYFMGDFVDAIGRMLDLSQEAVRDGVEKELEHRRKKARESVANYVDDGFVAKPPSNTESTSPVKHNHLYLMRHTNGLTKIGISVNPAAREKTLQAEDPRLEMIFCTPADSWLERKLHNIFRDVRVRGEWFRLQENHVDWIVTFCEFVYGESRTSIKASCLS
jgi:hypothetical protein